LNSIERPCQTSAASQIVVQSSKIEFTHLKKNIVKSKSGKTARERHKNINFSQSLGWKNRREKFVVCFGGKMFFPTIWPVGNTPKINVSSKCQRLSFHIFVQLWGHI
jgi:hypothetical protein